ncbi:hypothetical protein HHK36_012455 [Tetracentron sinense]|uniref:Uncharacterized protein n=1 Tax=Tetracentron sinense TaxID=13715 RepID=A0A834Z9B2_TETSI|nr:hypothetical protein HHK36_012455 [Tetracentron sinense]
MYQYNCLADFKLAMNERIEFDQGWEFIQKGITRLKNILEGLPEPQFSSEEFMMLYTYPLLCFFHFCSWHDFEIGNFRGNFNLGWGNCSSHLNIHSNSRKDGLQDFRLPFFGKQIQIKACLGGTTPLVRGNQAIMVSDCQTEKSYQFGKKWEGEPSSKQPCSSYDSVDNQPWRPARRFRCRKTRQGSRLQNLISTNPYPILLTRARTEGQCQGLFRKESWEGRIVPQQSRSKRGRLAQTLPREGSMPRPSKLNADRDAGPQSRPTDLLPGKRGPGVEDPFLLDPIFEELGLFTTVCNKHQRSHFSLMKRDKDKRQAPRIHREEDNRKFMIPSTPNPSDLSSVVRELCEQERGHLGGLIVTAEELREIPSSTIPPHDASVTITNANPEMLMVLAGYESDEFFTSPHSSDDEGRVASLLSMDNHDMAKGHLKRKGQGSPGR